MNNSFLRHFVLLALMLFTARLGWSQGTTTAAMSGVISDKTGAGLPGATVIAVHTPTNTQYVAPTNADGRFNIQNMRVGGPYTVKVTFVGFKDVVREGLYLNLGQNQRFDQKLDDSSTELAEVTVSGRRDPVINSGRTGAATTVQKEQIQRLPTLTRSFQDFTRLTPQANGNSLGGRSGRYNNISIDGAANNDLFGLAGSGTPGGQAGTQPISLDAIQEFQIVLAPYDVRQGGFSGGGINAVTRSGTNKVEGSVFGFGRNQQLLRRNATDYLTQAANFSDYQTGFRVGGPIIKDKLFFFINAEVARRAEPILTNIRGSEAIGTPGTTNVTAAQAEQVRSALISRYNYDPGSYGDFTNRTESNKAFARLDWNINANNQLTLRHNYVDAFNDNLSRSITNFRFENNNYRFNSTTNSTVMEFNSKIGSSFSNNLIVGYQRIREKRDPKGDPFPQITIQTDGTNNAVMVVGRETFSNANSLNQDIVELTDNFTHYAGKHVITLGTHNEFFRFKNVFVRDLYGNYSFRSINDFLNSDPTQNSPTTPHTQPYSYSLSYPVVAGSQPAAEFRVSQLGVYLQDEYSVLDNLKLTGGVRIDLPILPTTPLSNPGFNAEFGPRFDVATTAVPTRQVLFSPRLGFNWDVFNNQTTQVRGGTGVFTGRPPYVWISNQYGNTGVDISRISVSAGSGTIINPRINFSGDPNNQPSAVALGLATAPTEIDVTSKDFKFPQQFRSNLAVDQKLPGGVVGTLEGIYSHAINDILYKDINIRPSTSNAPDGRPFYNSNQNARKFNPNYTNVILLDRTGQGYTYQLTAQLQKTFNRNLSASAAYTYGQSKDVNSGTSSQAYSNWRFNQVPGDPNNPPLSYSNYDLRHRVIASGSYSKEYAGHFATSFSLFYAGQSGSPFSYIFGNDVNGDGESNNDLLSLPTDLNTMVFEKTSGADTRLPADIKQQFINYANNDEYLKTQKGNITERNGARLPWTHQVDIRVMQDISFLSGDVKHTLQITFDVFNFGNLLNKNWGRQYFVANQAYSLLGYRQAGAADVTSGLVTTVGTPVYKYTDIANPYSVSQLSSRWQGQLGLRYLFN
jgi:outer membrane receptor protein involved in Fe transport